jgi:flagellar biosynthetic protein FliQ
MNNQQAIDMIHKTLYLLIELSLPLLGTALLIGLLISIFQAATQINESTLSFLPKIAAILFVIVLLTPWMIRKFNDYTINVYNKIPEYSKKK